MTETKIISETGMIDMDPKRTIIGGQRRRGIMLVLSSPSGAGKTSIAHELLERNPHIVRSISATTRQRRPEEVDGVDYTFMDREKFSLLLLKDQFLEHAKVFGHYYGTPKGPVDDHLAAGRDVIFVIDWQGAQQLTINAREDVVSVFILPPTRKELLERLQKRAQDSDEVIARRMTESPDEIAHWHEY
ncbi:MAG: guanylate kinase, partial [Pseudomonadota bacterium]|nr:guanylate kinase [Pseudomonadota bacterium]